MECLFSKSINVSLTINSSNILAVYKSRKKVANKRLLKCSILKHIHDISLTFSNYRPFHVALLYKTVDKNLLKASDFMRKNISFCASSKLLLLASFIDSTVSSFVQCDKLICRRFRVLFLNYGLRIKKFTSFVLDLFFYYNVKLFLQNKLTRRNSLFEALF